MEKEVAMAEVLEVEDAEPETKMGALLAEAEVVAPAAAIRLRSVPLLVFFFSGDAPFILYQWSTEFVV